MAMVINTYGKRMSFLDIVVNEIQLLKTDELIDDELIDLASLGGK